MTQQWCDVRSKQSDTANNQSDNSNVRVKTVATSKQQQLLRKTKIKNKQQHLYKITVSYKNKQIKKYIYIKFP